MGEWLAGIGVLAGAGALKLFGGRILLFAITKIDKKRIGDMIYRACVKLTKKGNDKLGSSYEDAEQGIQATLKYFYDKAMEGLNSDEIHIEKATGDGEEPPDEPDD